MRKIAVCVSLCILLIYVIIGVIRDAQAESAEDAKKALEEKGIEYRASVLGKYVKEGNEEVVKLFLAAGMYVDTIVDFGLPSLMWAAFEGQTEIAKILLEHDANIDKQEEMWGLTALMMGATRGNTDVVRLLLEHGADINIQSDYGNVLIVTAGTEDVEELKLVEMVQLLVDAGIDVNGTTDSGFTALMSAADAGNADIFHLLLELGADIQAKETDNTTMLMYAAYGGNPEIIQAVLESGADVNAVSDAGWTALAEAAAGGHADIFDLLLEKGANLNVSEQAKGTILLGAAKGGLADIVRMLVKQGVLLNETDGKGSTALICTSRNGDIEIVKMLLESRADVNIQNNRGWTALMQAVSKEHVEIIPILLQHGADVDLKGDYGTAVEMAKHAEPEVLELLQMYVNGENDFQKCENTIKRMKVLSAALNAYHTTHSIYPSADATTISAILSKTDPKEGLTGDDYQGPATDGWGTDIYYSVDGEGYTLKSWGKDAAEGSGNDQFDHDIVIIDGRLVAPKPLVDARARLEEQEIEYTQKAFFTSIRKGNPAMVTTFIDAGMDPNGVSESDETALMGAAYLGNLELVRLLLENGADVNLLTEDGTALMAAVMGERVEMVRFLLEQGADVNAKTEDGNSALTKAAKTGNAELFLLLKQAGAVEDDAQRRAQTIDRMKSLGTALGAYQIDFDTFPVAEQGVISTVIFQDDPQNGLTKNYYNGPATDAWGTEFTYSSDGETYLLKSFGADKAEGDSSGEFDQDIVFKDGYRISP